MKGVIAFFVIMLTVMCSYAQGQKEILARLNFNYAVNSFYYADKINDSGAPGLSFDIAFPIRRLPEFVKFGFGTSFNYDFRYRIEGFSDPLEEYNKLHHSSYYGRVYALGHIELPNLAFIQPFIEVKAGLWLQRNALSLSDPNYDAFEDEPDATVTLSATGGTNTFGELKFGINLPFLLPNGFDLSYAFSRAALIKSVPKDNIYAFNWDRFDSFASSYRPRTGVISLGFRF